MTKRHSMLVPICVWPLLLACPNTERHVVGAEYGATSGAGAAPGVGASSGAGAKTSAGSPTADAGASGSADDGGSAGKSGSVLGHPDPALDYPAYPGFTLYLAEEFDSPLDLARDELWTYSDGGPPEAQTRYVKSALSVADGKLSIVANRETAPASQSYSENRSFEERRLTSGELRTKYNNFRYGRYEAAIKAPNLESGFAFFVNGFGTARQPHYQDWREIAVELVGDDPGAVVTRATFANDTPAWSPELVDSARVAMPDTFHSGAETHVYAFEWLPDGIAWYVDGQLIRRATDAGAEALRVEIPDKSGKIVVNLWTFTNSFVTPPGNANYPLRAEIDYVRFYRWDQDTTYPCTPVPGCLPVEDKDAAKNNAEDGVAEL